MAAVVASAGASPPPPPPPGPQGPPQHHTGGEEEDEEEEEEEERQFLPEDPRPYKPKEHIIWQFFKIPRGQKKVNAAKVTCLICGSILSRGNPNKKYSFGNHTMIRHMNRLHPNNYAAAEVREMAQNLPPSLPSTSSMHQPTPSGRDSREMVPNIQDFFGNYKIMCKFCGALLAYGEQSIKLINVAGQNHKCGKKH